MDVTPEFDTELADSFGKGLALIGQRLPTRGFALQGATAAALRFAPGEKTSRRIVFPANGCLVSNRSVSA